MADYRSEIPSQPRPFLPHEHPSWKDNVKSFVKRLKLLTHYRRPYKKIDEDGILVLENLDNYLNVAQGPNSPLHQHCCFVAEYLLESWYSHYAQQDFGRAYYPGWPSEQGINSDSIEGVTRIIPLLAAYLSHQQKLSALDEKELKNKGVAHLLVAEKQVAWKEALKQAFLSATNPEHKAYWGKLQSFSQTVCESADFALALWISKDFVFATYRKEEQERVLSWLREVSNCQTVDNNWHLFKLTVQATCKALEKEFNLSSQTDIDLELYQRIKEFYLDQGWFRDGAKGDFDYYNSWGFYYSLYWLTQIAPELDTEWITKVNQEFAEGFIKLFSPQGFALFGRSAPYRLGATTGLLTSDLLNGKANGQHLRAFLSNNNYFLSKGALKNGMLTQGLFEADRRLIDPYSGPASSFWSLRPYILLFAQGLEIDVWSTPLLPLPIETSSYEYHIPTVALKISASKESQEIVASFYHEQYKFDPLTSKLQEQSFYLKAKEVLLGRSSRGKNNLLRKGVTTWSSKFNNYL